MVCRSSIAIGMRHPHGVRASTTVGRASGSSSEWAGAALNQTACGAPLSMSWTTSTSARLRSEMVARCEFGWRSMSMTPMGVFGSRAARWLMSCSTVYMDRPVLVGGFGRPYVVTLRPARRRGVVSASWSTTRSSASSMSAATMSPIEA